MPEPNDAEQTKTATEQKRTAYDLKMAALFSHRNEYPVDSPEREAAAEAILALWVAEGD
jgi:hypothetical protein